MSQNVSSAAVVIGALRVNGKNTLPMGCILFLFYSCSFKDVDSSILRKTIEGYLDSVPSLSFNAIKT